MEKLKAFFFLFLCFCVSSSFSPEVAEFVSQSFEPDSTISLVPLVGVSGNYSIIVADGVEAYVFDMQSKAPIKDQRLLSELLEQDAKARLGYEQKIENAKSFAEKARSAKEKSEAKCLQYIGDDGDPGCFDWHSCMVSCKSSPQCDVMMYSDGFLEEAMDWSLKRKEFELQLSKYEEGLDAIRFDQSAIDEKIKILERLSLLASNMSQNGIFLSSKDKGCIGANATKRCFEYCPKIDYSEGEISSQIKNLLSLKEALQEIASQKARAGAIIKAGQENDAYLIKRIEDYQTMIWRMRDSLRFLKETYIKISLKVNDSEVALMLADLEGISRKARNHAGNYKKSLAMAHEFDSLVSSIINRLENASSSYILLSSKRENFSERVRANEWLIGRPSAQAHLENLKALEERYPEPIALEEIPYVIAQLEEMENNLSSDIVKASEQAGREKAQGAGALLSGFSSLALPAAVAGIAAIALAAYALLKKRKMQK